MYRTVKADQNPLEVWQYTDYNRKLNKILR